jgi:hypothetical protein
MLIVLPGSRVILQAELINVVSLNNKIAALTAARNRILSSILNRLELGSVVEPGTHEAELIEKEERGRKRLWVEVR